MLMMLEELHGERTVSQKTAKAPLGQINDGEMMFLVV